MFRLDDDFLVSVGLGSLPVSDKKPMLQHIYSTLEMNVGMRLAEGMTDPQLDEFEALMNANNEKGALEWLETNVPNYRDVVAEELEKLRIEIKSQAPAILAASMEQQEAA